MVSPLPVILSGMQPSGELHIGNYLGSLKNFVALQNSGEYSCFFFIADYHALTEGPSPKELRANVRSLVATYLAAGLDPKKSTIFVQSQVPGHTELAWIFNTLTPVAELFRMTQYKDKAAHQEKNINAGLLTYPVLMASDILLYHPALVPVGDDQVQHLEIARSTARWFNRRFGQYFAEPKPLLTATPRIMSIAEPSRKMSKSAGAQHCIFLTDDPKTIDKKLSRAVSDSGAGDSAGGKNLFLLLQNFSAPDVVEHFTRQRRQKAIRFGELKQQLAHDIAEHFADFRARRAELDADPAMVDRVLAAGSARAATVAAATVGRVRQLVGLE